MLPYQQGELAGVSPWVVSETERKARAEIDAAWYAPDCQHPLMDRAGDVCLSCGKSPGQLSESELAELERQQITLAKQVEAQAKAPPPPKPRTNGREKPRPKGKALPITENSVGTWLNLADAGATFQDIGEMYGVSAELVEQRVSYLLDFW